jgi:multiple sugar transport system permease protein
VANPVPRISIAWILLAAYLSVTLFPFYWMFKSAIEPAAAVYHPHLLPQSLTIRNVVELFTGSTFLANAGNSLQVALMSSALVVVCSAVGGYALSRYPIPAKRALAQLILFSYMFPELLLGIPFFSIFKLLGLVNSLYGLALAHVTLSFPFALWLMWQTYQALPPEYEEAACMDGAGPLRTFLQIVCPMTLPAMAAVMIFAFAASWNDYVLSLMLIRDDKLFTLPVAISLFVTQLHFNWAIIQAAALLLAVPGLLLLMVGQRYLVKGFGGGLAN